MGRRSKPGRERQKAPEVFEQPSFDRTLAEAESDGRPNETSGGAGDHTCECGATEFLLEAFLHVAQGRANPEPVEVESMTCPECGRDYEAIALEDGRYALGEFRGFTQLDDD